MSRGRVGGEGNGWALRVRRGGAGERKMRRKEKGKEERREYRWRGKTKRKNGRKT